MHADQRLGLSRASSRDEGHLARELLWIDVGIALIRGESESGTRTVERPPAPFMEDTPS